MEIKQQKSALPFSLSYVLFILLFLACTAAMVGLCTLFEGTKSLVSLRSPEASAPGAQRTPVIVIDAGHGGEDGGTSGHLGGREILEKHLNLDVAQRLCTLLTDAGYTVVMTRTEDRLLYDRDVDYNGRKKALDMAARLHLTQQAADPDGALFVSIHMNSFPQSEYRGLQVYYSSNSADSRILAQSIQDTAREQLAPDNHRAIKEGENIYLLKNLSCPAVLVECGFLSNPDECAALATEEYQNRVAYVIFCALREYTAEHSQSN